MRGHVLGKFQPREIRRRIWNLPAIEQSWNNLLLRARMQNAVIFRSGDVGRKLLAARVVEDDGIGIPCNFEMI